MLVSVSMYIGKYMRKFIHNLMYVVHRDSFTYTKRQEVAEEKALKKGKK